jgi:hypothetical protein
MTSNVVDGFSVGGYDYELTNVSCGKPNCGKCPHGPYWYLKIRLGTGKTVKKYLGLRLPVGVAKP